MISRIMNSFFWKPSVKSYLSMNHIVAFAADHKIPSNEKIARIEKEFKNATDEVTYDNETKKYHMIRDKTLAVNSEGRCGTTLLSAAIESNDLDLATWLIEHQGADVNQGDPLMLAASTGNIKLMDYLLLKGADINKQTARWSGDTNEGNIIAGSTALHRAVRFGQIDAVKFLIQKGALLLADKNGETALDFGKKILEAIEIIRNKKENAENCQYIGNLLGYNELRFNDPKLFIYHRDNSKVPSSEAIQQIIDILNQSYEIELSISPVSKKR